MISQQQTRHLAALVVLTIIAAVPAFRALRSIHGFDTRAYIAAGYLLDQSQSPYIEQGFTGSVSADSPEAYFPPFLYHPSIALAYQGLNNLMGYDLDAIFVLTSAASCLLFAMGVILLMRAVGFPLWWSGVVLLLLGWSPTAYTTVLYANLGPAMAGLILLGAAATLRSRSVLAGTLFAVAALFKPPVWLLGIMLTLFWRPTDAKDKSRLIIAWLGVYLLATLVAILTIGAGSMGSYLEMVGIMGQRTWCMAFADASVGATFLRVISVWRPEYHDMVVYGDHQLPASLGWLHEDIALMRPVNLIGLLAFCGGAFLFRSRFAREPLASLALATLAAFLFQPANWPHNYGVLILVPCAIASLSRTRTQSNEPISLSRNWVIAFVLILVMYWPIFSLPVDQDSLEIAPTTYPPSSSELLIWHVARAVNSLPTLYLLAMTFLIYAAAKPGSPEDEAELAV